LLKKVFASIPGSPRRAHNEREIIFREGTHNIAINSLLSQIPDLCSEKERGTFISTFITMDKENALSLIKRRAQQKRIDEQSKQQLAPQPAAVSQSDASSRFKAQFDQVPTLLRSAQSGAASKQTSSLMAPNHRVSVSKTVNVITAAPTVAHTAATAAAKASPLPPGVDVNDVLAETTVFTAPRPRILWRCTSCSQQCIPVRRESRCLCGHRLKEHASPATIDSPFSCSAKGCVCKHFKFVVAEGAWVLKCRCKHKHTEHDCGKEPFACKRCPGSSCAGFDSPWVCNCGHGYSSHEQLTVMRSERDMGALLQDVYSGDGSEQPQARTFAVRQDGLLAKELRDDAARVAKQM